jgi:hypothetical protein
VRRDDPPPLFCIFWSKTGRVSTNLLSLPLLYQVGGLFIVAFNILGDITKNFRPGFDLRSAVDIRSI